jgi:general transcription factor 3C polypeptide 5 (transcription factor C subunit 1)
LYLVSKLKEFKFDPSLRTGKGQEIIPPPYFTDRTIPFNYFYEQNPYVREQGKDEHGKPIIVNVQSGLAQTYGHYIDHDQYPVPAGPTKNVANSRQVPKDLLERTRAALDERPIWTRRALIQRVAPYYSDNSLKIAIQLVGYQFKGGPFRDAVIRYGVDPRTDPSYRVYQTLAFKLDSLPVDSTVKNGVVRRMGREEARRSHLWDGTSYCTNGKFWQICDIRDPALLGLIEAAPLRDTCDIVADGWYYAGTWSKIKAFMKAKMIAIQADRLGSEADDVDDNKSNDGSDDNNAGNNDIEAGEDGAAPGGGRKTKRKPGYIYDSVLLEKLAQWKDIPPDADKRYMVNVISLLYGLEDVAGLEGLRYRYRPRADFRDPLTAMGFGSKRPRRRRPLPGLGELADAAAGSSFTIKARAKGKRPTSSHPSDDGLGRDAASSRSSSSPPSDDDERDADRRSGSDDGEDGEGATSSQEPQYPDDAWAHILDSDLDSSSDQADEDENDEEGVVDDEGDEDENNTMAMIPEEEAETHSVGDNKAAGQGALEEEGGKEIEQQDVDMHNADD